MSPALVCAHLGSSPVLEDGDRVPGLVRGEENPDLSQQLSSGSETRKELRTSARNKSQGRASGELKRIGRGCPFR